MNDKAYLKRQIIRARKAVESKPQSTTAQDRLEFLLEQYRLVDTTPWRGPALHPEEMRLSHG